MNDSEITYGTSQAYLIEGSQCKHLLNWNEQFVNFHAAPDWFDPSLIGHVYCKLKAQYVEFMLGLGKKKIDSQIQIIFYLMIQYSRIDL